MALPHHGNLLFSGFFVAYAVFRMLYPDAFRGASSYYLDWRIGFINTCVLLLSSYTIAASIRNAQKNQQGLLKVNLLITIACAVFFLVTKLWLEYWPKIQKGEFGGALFSGKGTWAGAPVPLHLLGYTRRTASTCSSASSSSPGSSGARPAPLRPLELPRHREHRPLLARRRPHLDLPSSCTSPERTLSRTAPTARPPMSHDHTHDHHHDDHHGPDGHHIPSQPHAPQRAGRCCSSRLSPSLWRSMSQPATPPTWRWPSSSPAPGRARLPHFMHLIYDRML